MLGLVDIVYLGLFNALDLDKEALAKLESIVHLFGQEDEQLTGLTRGKE